MPRVLVVDDELGVQESLRMLLKGECEVATASNVDAALQEIDSLPPDLVLLDLVMPGRNGLELLDALVERGLAPPVIVLTATKTVATAVEAMKLGALDYVTKPFEIDALRLKVRRVLEQRAVEAELQRLRDEVRERASLGDMLGRSAPMQEVFRTLERLAAARASVLITGESGTGKELAAQAIHSLSPRAEAPFVAINCAAIPETLIEAELFGHERGAFTDAKERRTGKFEAAAAGTLFLDEIGELPSEAQAKLLRALQERRIERLGGSQSIPVDVRVIAATNRDLEQEVARRRFREDLYYRINVVQVHMPPLRERRGDVPLLTDHLLEGLAAEHGGPPRRLDSAARGALDAYAWPGNVRELHNALERAVALSDRELLSLEDLPDNVVQAGRLGSLREQVRGGELGYEDAVARFEREILRDALERNAWNQTRTAEALRITRRLLKLKMDKLGIADRDGEAAPQGR